MADRVTLGRGDVRVGPLGLGCAALGNLFAALPDDQAASTVDAAWEAGIRTFDTAPHYGLGLSERRLGASLRARPRDEYVLSTKVGRLLAPAPSAAATSRDQEGFDVPATHVRRWDFSAEGVRRSLESSLDRLGLSRVDVLLLHDPDDHHEWTVREAYPALRELRAAGVIGAIGAGMNDASALTSLVEECDLDVVLLAGRYTVLEQGALDRLLPACVRRGTSVLAGGVFNSGLLAEDRPGPDATYDYTTAPAPLIERARRIADVCDRHGARLPQVALQLPLAHPAVAGVLVGARSSDEIIHDVALAAEPVPAECWADLKAEGLLRTDVPVPEE
ncbi:MULTISPECIES: aldo/keto reductase [Actinoalloteichus]|uniref:Oxidoreductase, aryl-alcohol dehydrogenase like protein n=1 Tax=Actinoalloteichus fjordicus TaxID=1612552 RepID=A0AAC9PRW5_9PSEU|nr:MULTISPECIES: aldo/keto reductase [Actinoalloteichus]APU14435.1 putative oxidoreductase, aryl-alcohol dehydrogenase like protein [Actinoalloteichus fjordicus]APU20404.1 putative oxidoreductase, aryl-alcohol dehydrogenase like protein [Actinoalloteichus sp. GBA129-24]